VTSFDPGAAIIDVEDRENFTMPILAVDRIARAA
jgi:hypothetical protein